MKIFKRRQKTPEPLFECEVCGHTKGKESGVWDYCDKGHTYVSERIDLQPKAQGA